VLLNKIDLLPHVSFEVDRCIDYLHQVNPEARVLQVSATSGQGMDLWYEWLLGHVPTSLGTRSTGITQEQTA
jgi:hydrogenase nickel incorporation protein HypB